MIAFWGRGCLEMFSVWYAETFGVLCWIDSGFFGEGLEGWACDSGLGFRLCMLENKLQAWGPWGLMQVWALAWLFGYLKQFSRWRLWQVKLASAGFRLEWLLKGWCVYQLVVCFDVYWWLRLGFEPLFAGLSLFWQVGLEKWFKAYGLDRFCMFVMWTEFWFQFEWSRLWAFVMFGA